MIIRKIWPGAAQFVFLSVLLLQPGLVWCSAPQRVGGSKLKPDNEHVKVYVQLVRGADPATIDTLKAVLCDGNQALCEATRRLVVGILGVNGSIQDGAVLVTDAVLRSFHGVAALSRENIYALDRFLKGPGIPNRLPVRLAPPVFVASIHPPAEWINLPLAAVGRNSHQVFVSDGGVGIMFSFGVHSRSGRVFLMEWQTCKLQKSASDSSDD